MLRQFVNNISKQPSPISMAVSIARVRLEMRLIC